MIPLLNVDLPRILLSAPKGYLHGPYGGYGVIIIGFCQCLVFEAVLLLQHANQVANVSTGIKS